MGIRLSFSRAPRTVPLGDGAALTMRPATAVEHAAAEASAARAIRDAIAGVDALRDIGIEPPDAADLADLSYVIGLSRYLVALDLAVRIVTGWTGVTNDEAGTPAELDRAGLGALLLDQAMLAAFERAAYVRLNAVVAEGNGSAPLPTGSAAGALNIAAAAAPTGSPAPPASPDPTETSVR